MDEQNIRSDLEQIRKLKPPVKRAAYSDRTAWLMADLAELAYEPFEGEQRSYLLELAAELAELTDADDIAKKLETLSQTMNARNSTNDTQLRAILDVGGFRLKGTLLDRGTDTQGFVASRQLDGELGMAVVCFRGTTNAKDWMTNLDIKKSAVSDRSGNRVLGYAHEGFHKAYKSVEPQIREYLQSIEDLPLYITGHSLGGALATLATWHLSGDKLAACYTFGAPRAVDAELQGRFRTPIYRIVNGADPVPLLPPSGPTRDVLVWIVRKLGSNAAAGWLANLPDFKHCGYQRYLTMCAAGDGTYPKLRNEYQVNGLKRFSLYVWSYFRREGLKAKRLDRYHGMEQYRAKLRAYALRRHGSNEH